MLSFQNAYTLKNKIAELSPLQPNHEAELFQVSNDKEIWTHFTEDGYGRENFEAYMSNALEKRNQGTEYPLVIRDLRDNKLAGMTRIYEVNNELKNVKLGHTWIGQKYQGTGLNKVCKFLLFQFLFEQLGYERIGFGASASNTKSIKAMLSVGCTIEGRLRGYLPVIETSERVDIVLLSILKPDWLHRVKAELESKIQHYINP